MTPPSSAAETVEDGRPRAATVAEAIRLAVIEQRLAPGTRLSEDQLGALFAVSRTVVRSALQALAHDGIVALARNRGASVAAPSVAEARHLFDARQVVEGVIAARAAAHITRGAARQLDGLIRRGQRAVEAGDRGLAIRLSGDFHLAIAVVADQPILADVLAGLVSRTSLVIALYGRSRTADCGGEDHRTILSALQAGDGEAAARRMGEHLAHIAGDLDLAERDRPATPLRDALLPAGGTPRQAPVTRRSGW